MIRENRYLVFKQKELWEALDAGQLLNLKSIITTIDYWREANNKDSLDCVVVESDWPEYEVVWKLIEDRVDKGG